MLVALVLFNIVHPGRIMSGKGSDMPSFRERRRERHVAKPVDGRFASSESEA